MGKIKKGNFVEWKSQSGGIWKMKRGTVLARLDEGVHAITKCPKKLWGSIPHRYKMFNRVNKSFIFDKASRKRLLVIVSGSDGKARLYTPYASKVVAV